jgi:hypothetical protein
LNGEGGGGGGVPLLPKCKALVDAYCNNVIQNKDCITSTVRVFDRKLHSRMPLDPTHVRLKRTRVWPMAFLSGVHFSYQFTL